MLYLLLVFAVTAALACDPVTNLVTTSVRSSEIRVSWSAPTTAQLQCIKAYRICSTPESCTTVQGSSVTEYSVTGLESCTQYNVSVVTLDETNATSTSAVVITRTAPGPAIILGYSRRDNETILVTWSYAQTAGRTCATQFQLSLCDNSGANCSNTNIAVDISRTHYSLFLLKNRSCNAFVLHLVALDSSQQMSDSKHLEVVSYVNGDKVLSGAEVQETTTTTMLVAWNTSLPIDQCIAAYTVCLVKQDSAANNCHNVTSCGNSISINGLAADTKYEVTVTALLHSGIRYDSVTLEASTKSGAGGTLVNTLIGISTIGLILGLLIAYNRGRKRVPLQP